MKRKLGKKWRPNKLTTKLIVVSLALEFWGVFGSFLLTLLLTYFISYFSRTQYFDRDMKFHSFSMCFHGKELITNTEVNLLFGKRYLIIAYFPHV